MTLALPDNDGGWYPGWGWFWIFWVVVLAAILVGCYARPGRRRWTFRGDAEAVLAERFARGDIDADEYQRRLAMLREAPSPQNRGGYR
jgi:putative membrane protein